MTLNNPLQSVNEAFLCLYVWKNEYICLKMGIMRKLNTRHDSEFAGKLMSWSQTGWLHYLCRNVMGYSTLKELENTTLDSSSWIVSDLVFGAFFAVITEMHQNIRMLEQAVWNLSRETKQLKLSLEQETEEISISRNSID